MERVSLFGMGNPLLDISAEVEDKVLEKYDLKLNNAVLAEPKHMALYQELVDTYHVDYIAGGATQNAIRVAQWILETPRMTSMVGAIGNDKFGDTLQQAAEKDNVNVQFLRLDDVATGTCAVLVNNNERSLVANVSAAGKYDISHLKQESIQRLVNEAKFFYIAGFFLTVSVPSALEVATHSLKNGKTFAMNLSAPFVCQFFKDPLMSLMPMIDLLFGNESECAAFGEAMGFDVKTVPEIAQKIAQLERHADAKGPRMVVITQGKDSTVVATPDKVATFDVSPIAADELVDVNGAGDAFVGGFLAQLVKGEGVERCVACGHYAAGVVIRNPGCTFPPKPEFK